MIWVADKILQTDCLLNLVHLFKQCHLPNANKSVG